MRVFIILWLLISGLTSASDDFMMQVCEATVGIEEKRQCFADISAELEKQKAIEASWLYGPQCKYDSDCYAVSVYTTNDKWRYRCTKAIESRAKYQFRWTGGWTEDKFPQFTTPKLRARNDLSAYTVGFVGKAIQFQNGFSAWSNMTYICWYNPVINKVVEAKIFEGSR